VDYRRQNLFLGMTRLVYQNIYLENNCID